ncbi:hypothetical protein BC829DRAFT_401460 [Chytridium lagenaria]|nr:hypothetical protein BC829DRAFT_401460 [Chytridium lagenaria]
MNGFGIQKYVFFFCWPGMPWLILHRFWLMRWGHRRSWIVMEVCFFCFFLLVRDAMVDFTSVLVDGNLEASDNVFGWKEVRICMWFGWSGFHV